MKHIVRLSYSMSMKMPLYPGTPPTEVSTVKCKETGDSCNTSRITISNHAGTHIDGPAHFDISGRRIGDYDIESFVFGRPIIVDCPKEAGVPIMPDDLAGSLAEDTDILLIRTGFSKYRNPVVDDCYSDLYCSRNPYLHSDTAMLLRNRHPNIRAIGIDCISIGCHTDRENGRRTHDTLLSRGSSPAGDPIFIIEDMFIPEDLALLDTVIVAPLYFDGIDSAPCTVIGVFSG